MRTARIHAFSVSAQAATTTSAVNVGVGTTAPTSNFQLATGSTFDLGTAKAQWTDTGITTASAVANAVGTFQQVTVTGPSSGLYTSTVIANPVLAYGAYLKIAAGLTVGATYQVSITLSSSNSAKFYIRDDQGGLGTFIYPTSLTTTQTAYTSAPVKINSQNIYLFFADPIVGGWNMYFKDLSISRLDTTLYGNVGIGITNPPERLTVLGPSASTYAAGFASIGLYTGFGGQNTSGADAVSNQIKFGAWGPYIRTVIPNASYADNLRLELCSNLGSNDATPRPRLTIVGGASQNSGLVGIGTYAAGATRCRLAVYDATTTNWAGFCYFGGSTNGVVAGELDGVATIGSHNAAMNAWSNLSIGGWVGIGVTYPSVKLEVAGGVKATGGFISWSTVHTYNYITNTWNPGDAGNWPIGGYHFLITMMAHPSLGAAAVRASYIVYHSRWAAGNNNFGMISPIGTPQWVSATAITDGGMSFTFNSGAAQDVYINVMAL